MLNRIVHKPGHALIQCEQMLRQQVIELLTEQTHVPCDLCPDRRILEMASIGDFLDELPDNAREFVHGLQQACCEIAQDFLPC